MVLKPTHSNYIPRRKSGIQYIGFICDAATATIRDNFIGIDPDDNGLANSEGGVVIGGTFGDFTMTSSLVFGGAFSLDGVHLTSRGYALVAYKMLEAIDNKYGSNFKASGNMPSPDNYPTNYPPGI